MSAVSTQFRVAELAARYVADPAGYCKAMFPWGEPGPLQQSQGPRTWQLDVLDEIGQHLRSENRFQPLWLAIASGHGIGKSAEVGMVTNWAQSTCPGCKIIITAGTGTQLATKTAPEVAKWFRLSYTRDWWDLNATSIRHRDAKLQSSWRTDFITWSEHNTDPFAGLHNLNKRIVLIFDEASAIGDKVWEVAEGAMTDENTEIIWLAYGNPTQNTGRFRECFGRFAHRWKHKQIDSRQVEGTNKAQIQKWIDDYGEDSDFVRVRVRGEFPRAGSNQFIGSDVVALCRKYRAEGYDKLPKILSVDVARFGDDQTVIGSRQGRKSAILARYRGLDTVQSAERLIEFMGTEQPDATVVDGDGIGAGVIDHVRHRGFGAKLFEFHGGQTPSDPQAYFNKRAECWGMMRDWLMSGAEIPDDPELETDLTAPEYGFSSKQQIQLEKKEDMKKRGLASPDAGDMLAMTFSVTVLPKYKPVVEERIWREGSQQLEWMA